MNTENFFSHLYLDICLGIEERNKMSTMSDGAKICLNWYFKHVNASVFCRLFNLCLTHILLFISVSKCYVSFSYITHSFKSKKIEKICITKISQITIFIVVVPNIIRNIDTNYILQIMIS